MTILLTGATGFIGKHFVRLALERGVNVLAVVRRDPPPELLDQSNIRFFRGGIGDVSSADIVGCDALVHLAAHGVVDGGGDWDTCFGVNVVDSLRLWRAAAAAGVKRFVICGSCFEYGRSGERYKFIPVDAPLEPTGAYHASKASATMAALALAVEKRLELAVLRPFHVFGEGEAITRLWPALRKAAIAGSDLDMTFGEQIRDFIPVEEVARLFLDRVLHGSFNAGRPSVANIGSGRQMTIRAFAEQWWAYWGATGHLRFGALPYRSDEVMRYVPLVERPKLET